MEKKVVGLIKDIIGNGAPCSKQDWITIKTALAEAEKTANNTAMVPCPYWEPSCRCKLHLRKACDGKRCQISAQHQ